MSDTEARQASNPSTIRGLIGPSEADPTPRESPVMTADSISIAQHIVAVDGPAAAGKTTTSRALSARYGLRYLESGMAYRFMAYMALRRDIDVDDGRALLQLYSTLVNASESSQNLLEESRRHAGMLRSREVSKAVSMVSRRPELRAIITDLIRSWASVATGSVIEGRDIGTTVFPSAKLKFFLTAAPDVRARRRWKDEAGTNYQEILDDILRRDAADSSRAASPLKPADDSLIIDTSDLTVEEVLSRMKQRCEEVGLVAAEG